MNFFKNIRVLTRDLSELDKRLKTQKPSPQTPPWLHSSIMNALEGKASLEKPSNYLLLLRRVALAACAVVFVVGIWWTMNRPAAPPSASFAAATDALDFGVQIQNTLPQVQLAPLSDELERLSRDLGNATETLIASLP